MSLLEELKEKLQTVCAEQDEQLAKIRVHEAFLGAAMQDIRDLSRAIAALEPSAVEGSSVAAYFDARRAEALLDHQPGAASPEFASDQDEALEDMIATSEAICEELSEVYTSPAIPEGFTPWSGGECPTHAPYVEYILRSGQTWITAFPHSMSWDHKGYTSDVIAYRATEVAPEQITPAQVQPSAEAERIEDVSQAETVNEQSEIEYYVDGGPVKTTSALITDDIPSIPRSEIPEGSAVETFVDVGIQTVKLGGQTYLVDDEPALPVAEAAYAPVNSEPTNEALMWANGFQTDAKSKAEPEQDKRPFWMFAKKVDA